MGVHREPENLHEQSEKNRVKLYGGWERYQSAQICFLKWNHRLCTLSGRKTKQGFLNVLYLIDKYFNRACMQSYRWHGHALLRAHSKRAKGIQWMWEGCCALPGTGEAYLLHYKGSRELHDGLSLLFWKSFITETAISCTPRSCSFLHTMFYWSHIQAFHI